MALATGDEEDLPRQRVSFVKSNEIRHDTWFPYIEGLGGAYVGLGSDPNYTLVGIARSEVGSWSIVIRWSPTCTDSTGS